MAAKNLHAHHKPPVSQSNLNKIKKISSFIFLLPCTSQEMLTTKLKNRKACRTIDIETRFIKLANPVIFTFLSNLFDVRVCLNAGVYPDSLKIAEIIPILKKGCLTQTTNYRPISLLCQFSKIFEKLLHTRIYSYLIRYNLLNNRQLGF